MKKSIFLAICYCFLIFIAMETTLADNFNVESVGALTIPPYISRDIWGTYTIAGAVSVVTVGNYSYVTGFRNKKGEPLAWGLWVIDISVPTHPEEVGFCVTSTPIPYRNAIKVEGNYAYVISSKREMIIIDLSVKSDPKQISSYNIGDTGGLADIYVSDKYAYVAFYDRSTTGELNSNLYVIDISNPMQLQKITIFNTQGLITGVYVAGNYVYLAGSNGLRVIDISDILNLHEVGSYPILCSNIYVADRYAYITSGGLHVIDISDPAKPYEVGSYPILWNPNNVYILDRYAYVTSLIGLSVIDISDPKNLIKVGSYNTYDQPYDICVTNEYVCLIDVFLGLHILKFIPGNMPQSPILSPISKATYNGETSGNYDAPYGTGSISFKVSEDGSKIMSVSVRMWFIGSITYPEGLPIVDNEFVFKSNYIRFIGKFVSSEFVFGRWEGLTLNGYKSGIWSACSKDSALSIFTGQDNLALALILCPSISDIPDQTINEGKEFTSIKLDDYVKDPDNNYTEITWAYNGNSSLTVNISKNHIATITAPKGWTGSESVTFSAKDPSIEWVERNYDSSLGDLSPKDTVKFTVKPLDKQSKGDVNGDKEVRANDAILALRIAAGLITPTDDQKWLADMNDDGEVRSNDAILILRKAAGFQSPTKNPIANSRISISLTETYGLKGEIISVPITVDNVDVLSSGDISIRYDGKVLRAIDILSNDGLLMASNTNQSGLINISFANVERLNGGKLADIKFEVLTDDISPLAFKTVELYGYDSLPLNTKFTDKQFKSWAIKPQYSELLQNYPNPFNPETWIPYQLNEDGEVVIRIHNVAGDLVHEIRLGYKPAGLYTTQDRSAYWNGKNEAGEKVASGLYFYTIQAGKYTATRKMLLLK